MVKKIILAIFIFVLTIIFISGYFFIEKKQSKPVCSVIPSCQENKDIKKISPFKITNEDKCGLDCGDIGLLNNENPANVYKKCFDQKKSEINCFIEKTRSEYPAFNINLNGSLKETTKKNIAQTPFCRAYPEILKKDLKEQSYFYYFQNGKYLYGKDIIFYKNGKGFSLDKQSPFYNVRGDEINCGVFNNEFGFSCWDAINNKSKPKYLRICDTETKSSVFKIASLNNYAKVQRSFNGVDMEKPLSCEEISAFLGVEANCSVNFYLESYLSDPYNNMVLLEEAQKNCSALTKDQTIACGKNEDIEKRNSEKIKFFCCEMKPYFVGY